MPLTSADAFEPLQGIPRPLRGDRRLPVCELERAQRGQSQDARGRRVVAPQRLVGHGDQGRRAGAGRVRPAGPEGPGGDRGRPEGREDAEGGRRRSSPSPPPRWGWPRPSSPRTPARSPRTPRQSSTPPPPRHESCRHPACRRAGSREPVVRPDARLCDAARSRPEARRADGQARAIRHRRPIRATS